MGERAYLLHAGTQDWGAQVVSQPAHSLAQWPTRVHLLLTDLSQEHTSWPGALFCPTQLQGDFSSSYGYKGFLRPVPSFLWVPCVAVFLMFLLGEVSSRSPRFTILIPLLKANVLKNIFFFLKMGEDIRNEWIFKGRVNEWIDINICWQRFIRGEKCAGMCIHTFSVRE